MKKIFLFLLPCFLLASSEANYDITERTFNFLLFAGLLYYLVANPAKEMYNQRIKGIADELDGVQKKLKASKEKKEEAKRKLEEARANSANIAQTAKKEAEILSKKILANKDEEIKSLEKLFEDAKEIEQRKMTRSVVKEVIDEIFESESAEINSDELLNIVLKKVA